MRSGRGRRALVAGALLAAGCYLALGSEPGPDAAGSRAVDTLGDCIRTGALDSVEAVNRFVAKVRGDGAFAGGDVGASAVLQDGRRLFVFGDTLRSPDFEGQRFVHNSMLVFSPSCGRVVMPRDHGAVVPDRDDGVGYWPMSIARVERDGYDLVGVGLQRVRATGGSSVFSFEVLGPAVARFVVPRGGTPRFTGVRDIGADDPDTTRPMWGAAAVVDSGWVYLYGTSRPATANLHGFALRVARARPDSVVNPDRWQFWDGRSWSPDAAAAAELIGSVGGVSQTLSVFHVGKDWYALSKRDEVLGSDLTIWTAPGPTGPFVAAPASASIPSDAVTGTLRYMPLAHPDLLPVPGTVVVSYSVNNSDFSVVQDDPRRYRPYFLRVRLPE